MPIPTQEPQEEQTFDQWYDRFKEFFFANKGYEPVGFPKEMFSVYFEQKAKPEDVYEFMRQRKMFS